MIIDISKELLMRLGYMVLAVNSGEAAVATVRRKGTDIDLVLLDFMEWQRLILMRCNQGRLHVCWKNLPYAKHHQL